MHGARALTLALALALALSLALTHTRCTALEQKWLLRVITKDLAIGLKEDKIFKMLHPDAQELYNSVCDLKQTCERCADPAPTPTPNPALSTV